MADLINFNLSRRATDVADFLQSTGLFDSALGAAKFAAAYALNHHFDEIKPDSYTMPDNDGKQYGAGSVDADLVSLLKAVYPECITPVIYSRNLMTFGLLKLGTKIESEGLQPISSYM